MENESSMGANFGGLAVRRITEVNSRLVSYRGKVFRTTREVADVRARHEQECRHQRGIRREDGNGVSVSSLPWAVPTRTKRRLLLAAKCVSMMKPPSSAATFLPSKLFAWRGPVSLELVNRPCQSGGFGISGSRPQVPELDDVTYSTSPGVSSLFPFVSLLFLLPMLRRCQ